MERADEWLFFWILKQFLWIPTLQGVLTPHSPLLSPAIASTAAGLSWPLLDRGSRICPLGI